MPSGAVLEGRAPALGPRALACLVSRDSELAYLLRSLIKLSPPPSESSLLCRRRARVQSKIVRANVTHETPPLAREDASPFSAKGDASSLASQTEHSDCSICTYLVGSLKAGFVTVRSELGSCRAFRVQYPIFK